MNREELLKHHAQICNRAMEIMQGFLVRVIDKVSRLATFVDAGELKVKGETWKDAVLDIMNYMILFSAYVSDKQGNELPEGTEEFLIEELEVTPNTVEHHPV